jgi:acyl carrier protein
MSLHTDVSPIIRKFILRQFPAARYKDFADDVSLLDSGIVDSMGILEIVAFLEREFTITIIDEDLSPENFASVGTLTEFLLKKTIENR